MKREFQAMSAVLAFAAALSVSAAGTSNSLIAQQDQIPAAHIARNPGAGSVALTADVDRDAPEGTGAIIRQAAQSLAEGPPLQAQLRYRIDMFGQRISGPGRYFQAGQGTGKTRIEFEFGFNEMAVQLQQFCDGTMLYSLTKAGDETTLEFVDLRRLEGLHEQMPNGERVASWLSIGSLTGLLNQLAEHFEFGDAVPGQLDRIPVLECTGQWRASAIQRLLHGQIDPAAVHGNTVDWQMLPTHLPHQVRITLGDDERFPGFPYRVVFEQFEFQEGKAVAKPVAVLELYEVRHAPELTDGMFQLPSIDTPPVDATSFYEQRIQQFAR
jgi:hypothetical protein